MITYTYKLISADHALVEGTTQAFLKQQAIKKLQVDGAKVIFIARKPIDFLNIEVPFLSRNFPDLERIAFYRNFSAMVETGMSMVLILDTLTEQVQGKKIKEALTDITHGVNNGKSLSKCLGKYPHFFPRHITETIRVGEVAGVLGSMLSRIGDDLAKNYELRKKVIGAIAYPVVVIVLMIAVMVGLIIFVLPQIEELFADVGAEAPMFTRILIAIGNAFHTYPHVILLGVVTVIVAFIAAIRTPKGKFIFDSITLRIPIFGPLIKEFNLAVFFRSLQSLISSGVSLVNAVDVSRNTLRNSVYVKAIDDSYPLLIHGSPLSETLKPFPGLFPLQSQRMIKVGEQTGRLTDTFKNLVTHYESSANYRTTMLTTMLEPVLMVVVGIAVAMLALSIFMPIYQIATFL